MGAVGGERVRGGAGGQGGDAAAKEQLEEAGKKEDAEEEKLFRYATASEAQLYALPPDTWVAAVDGGYTAAQEPAGADAGAPEKSGFGFSVHEVWLKGLTPKRPRHKWRRRPTIPKDKPQEERQIESDAWEMATEAERNAWQEGAKERVVKRRRTHGLGKFELGPQIEHGFGPVVLDPQDPHFVGCIRRSANTAEITAQTQVLLWFRELRREHPDTTPRNLAILYDSDTAFKAI
eukprot:COSAG01_NODE_314_length_19013_cov_164.111240_9_plen_234_part_00